MQEMVSKTRCVVAVAVVLLRFQVLRFQVSADEEFAASGAVQEAVKTDADFPNHQSQFPIP